MTITILTDEHLARTQRAPIINSDLCYGYETVLSRASDPAGYKASLYAVTVSGRVFHRLTVCADTFHRPRAKWTQIFRLPKNVEFIGHYPVPQFEAST